MPEELDRKVRLAVYRHFAAAGTAPGPDELATAVGAAEPDVEASLRRLSEAHLLVLHPDGAPRIWMAQPFSAVPTAFRVEAGGRSYFGNCIWDALGIPALLAADGVVSTGCADCGEPLELRVTAGRLEDDDGVAHFAVPAAHWWEDIGHT
jgi:hypothetical protein